MGLRLPKSLAMAWHLLVRGSLPYLISHFRSMRRGQGIPCDG